MPVKYDKGKNHGIWYRKRSKEIFLINQRLTVTVRSNHLFCIYSVSGQEAGDEGAACWTTLSLASTPCSVPAPLSCWQLQTQLLILFQKKSAFIVLSLFFTYSVSTICSHFNHTCSSTVFVFKTSMQVSLPQPCLMPSVRGVPCSSQTFPGVYKWTQIFQGGLCYLWKQLVNSGGSSPGTQHHKRNHILPGVKNQPTHTEKGGCGDEFIADIL